MLVSTLTVEVVRDLINLPQMVVLGDQYWVRSSVLEGLIRRPCPRGSGQCTRLATQIIFQWSLNETTPVSIIPSVGATEEHKTSLHAWSRHELETLDPTAFALVMEEISNIEAGGRTAAKTASFTMLKSRLKRSPKWYWMSTRMENVPWACPPNLVWSTRMPNRK
jgi:hypothetical protein